MRRNIYVCVYIFIYYFSREKIFSFNYDERVITTISYAFNIVLLYINSFIGIITLYEITM